MSFMERVKDFLNRGDAARIAIQSEAQALQDEWRELSNESRFQSEPSFAEYLKRLRDEFALVQRELVYEGTEPRRSMLQGRCQMLLETIERPAAVQARLGAITVRLEELRAEAFNRVDGVTVEGVTAHNG